MWWLLLEALLYITQASHQKQRQDIKNTHILNHEDSNQQRQRGSEEHFEAACLRQYSDNSQEKILEIRDSEEL